MKKSPGRVSAAAEEINLFVLADEKVQLKPPAWLNDQEQAIFHEIIRTLPPGSIRKAELPLFTSFVQAVNTSRWYARRLDEEDGFKRWSESTRLCMNLAVKLRLAPSTRLDRKGIERRGELPDGPEPWNDF